MRAHSPDTGSRRGGRRRRRRSHTACRTTRSTSSRPRAAAPGARGAVVDAEAQRRLRPAASSATRGSSALTTSVAEPAAWRSRLSSALRCARALRSGRAGPGTGFRAKRHAGRRRRSASGNANSSTSRSPSSASRAASSVEAMPEARLAPERFHASRCRVPRMPAAMALVVVLPLVAETIAAPSGRRAESASIAAGSIFQRSFPGSVVPPPRPAARDSRPTSRAAEVSSARRAPIAAERTGNEHESPCAARMRLWTRRRSDCHHRPWRRASNRPRVAKIPRSGRLALLTE